MLSRFSANHVCFPVDGTCHNERFFVLLLVLILLLWCRSPQWHLYFVEVPDCLSVPLRNVSTVLSLEYVVIWALHFFALAGF